MARYKNGMNMSTYQYRAKHSKKNLQSGLNSRIDDNPIQPNPNFSQERQIQPVNNTQDKSTYFNPSLAMSSRTGTRRTYPTNPVPQPLTYQNIPNFHMNSWCLPAYNINFPPPPPPQNVPWINPWTSSCGLNTAEEQDHLMS